MVEWSRAVTGIGIPGQHFHDLRHTGNTLAAASGVSIRDLMARMGHDSMQAAMIYQHATTRADRAIAAALNEEMRSVQGATKTSRKGERDGQVSA